MRTAASLCCLLAASHALARDVPTYDARTFYETVTYFGASFSADETIEKLKALGYLQ